VAQRLARDRIEIAPAAARVFETFFPTAGLSEGLAIGCRFMGRGELTCFSSPDPRMKPGSSFRGVV
jgi:hypothetical protein